MSSHNLSTHNLFTHNFLTHNLSTHNFLTHNLSTHNLLTHNFSFLTSTGVALGHIHIRFTWQAWHLRHWAWHLATSTFVSRGRRGTWLHPHSFHLACVALAALGGLWWRTGFSADNVDAAALCVAGVALGHIHIRFTWQACHLRHWAGSGGAPASQMTPWTPRLFAWQAWDLVTSTFTLRGRRGTR